MFARRSHLHSTASDLRQQQQEAVRRGLVTLHISGGAGKRTWTEKPNGAVLHAPGIAPFAGRRGIRAPVRGLSPASRKRVLSFLAGVPWGAAPAYFVTLTYHFTAGGDPAKWYADLRAFTKRLEQDYASFGPSVFWLKEFQRRGAPHYHLVVSWRREPNLIQCRKWVARAWNEIAEPGDTLHWLAGTSVDPVRIGEKGGVKALLFYFVKYLGKSEQKQLIDAETGERLPTGRMWGVFGDFPQETIRVVELDEKELAQLLRRLRRWRRESPYFQRFGNGQESGVIIGEYRDISQLVRGLGTETTQPDERSP